MNQKSKIISTASQGWIRHGAYVAKFDRILLKASTLAVSLAIFGTSAALAEDASQSRESTVGDHLTDPFQNSDCGISHKSSPAEREFAAQHIEENPAIAYVPSYRTGLRWKN